MENIGLAATTECETDDFHRALHLFELPSAPSLLDDATVHPIGTQMAQDTTEEDSPNSGPNSGLHRGRRSVSLEQKQANNREHQRQFRARSKARQKAVEAQLAKTKSELEQLKARHKQLESVLERVSQPSPDPPPVQPLTAAEDPKNRDIDLTHLLSISIQGQTTHLTSDEVISMPMRQFSALWTAYVHELGQCLLQVDDDPTGKMDERLLVLSVEGMRLVGRRLLHNPAAHKALITVDLAEGQPTLLQLDSTFYSNLLSLLDLSIGQISDLMHLRRLYLTKRGLLAAQRRQLVSSIAFSDDQLRHPSDNSVDAADVGQSLKDNAREDQRVLYRVARVVWSGILSSKQLSLVMVHSYPYMPILEHFLDTLAVREGYPSSPDVIASAHKDPMTAAWRDFDEYAMYVHQKMFNRERGPYVPLSRFKAPCPVPGVALPRTVAPAEKIPIPKSRPLEMFLI